MARGTRDEAGGTQAEATQGGTQAPTGRDVRAEYRMRGQRLDDNEAELTQPTNSKLKDEVEGFNELFKVSREHSDAHETARNSAIDSRCILKASRLGTVQSSNLNNSTPLEFVRAIKRRYGNIPNMPETPAMTEVEWDKIPVSINWEGLSALACSAFSVVPAWDAPWDASLVAVVVKERKKAERRTKDVIEAEVRPQELTARDVNSVTEATQKRRCDAMRTMIDKAEKRAAAAGGAYAGLNFYHVVLNPEKDVGFGQTIENMFDFSFHLKEGHVSISLGEDGEPMVHIARPPCSDEYQTGLSKVQNILKLDYPTWERLCVRYGAGRLLPTRKKGGLPPPEAAAAGSGSGSGGSKRAKK